LTILTYQFNYSVALGTIYTDINSIVHIHNFT